MPQMRFLRERRQKFGRKPYFALLGIREKYDFPNLDTMLFTVSGLQMDNVRLNVGKPKLPSTSMAIRVHIRIFEVGSCWYGMRTFSVTGEAMRSKELVSQAINNCIRLP